MKTWVKWVLGIGIGLVVVACLAVAGLFVLNRMGWLPGGPGLRQFAPYYDDRVTPRGDLPMRPFRNMPHMYGGWGINRVPVFSGLAALCGLALFVGAVILIVVLLARRSGPAAGAPVMAATSAPPVESPRAVCPSCGSEVQKGWKHCPHCGADLPQAPGV